MYVEDMCCCGVGEIDGLDRIHNSDQIISTLKQFCDDNIALEEDYDPWEYKSDRVVKRRNKLRVRHLVFTQAITVGSRQFTYGNALKDYILKHKLGTVVATGGNGINPNHDNRKIRAFLWTPNHTNLVRWYKANGGE